MITLSVVFLILGILSFFALIATDGDEGFFLVCAVVFLILFYVFASLAPDTKVVKSTIVGKDSIYVLEDGKVIATVAAPKQCDTAPLLKKDYELSVTQDSLILFDDGRYVGSVPFGNTKFDSLILKDNY